MEKRIKFIKTFTMALLGATLLTSSPVEASTLNTVNQNNTNLVPLRVISEELGAKVDYNGATKEITVVYRESIIVTTVGSKSAVVNGNQQALQVAPQIIKGVTYVPIRFIGEALDGVVDYQKGSLKITIADQVKQWKLETTVYNPASEKINKKSHYLKKIENAKVKEKEIYNDPNKHYKEAGFEVIVLWDNLLEEIEGVIKKQLTADEKKKYAEEEKKWNDLVAKTTQEIQDEYHNPHATTEDSNEMTQKRCRVLVNQYMK